MDISHSYSFSGKSSIFFFLPAYDYDHHTYILAEVALGECKLLYFAESNNDPVALYIVIVFYASVFFLPPMPITNDGLPLFLPFMALFFV